MSRLLLEKMTDKLLSKNTPPTLPKRIGHSKHCRTISDHTLLFCKLPASGIANIFPHNHVNFVFHSLLRTHWLISSYSFATKYSLLQLQSKWYSFARCVSQLQGYYYILIPIFPCLIPFIMVSFTLADTDSDSQHKLQNYNGYSDIVQKCPHCTKTETDPDPQWVLYPFYRVLCQYVYRSRPVWQYPNTVLFMTILDPSLLSLNQYWEMKDTSSNLQETWLRLAFNCNSDIYWIK